MGISEPLNCIITNKVLVLLVFLVLGAWIWMFYIMGGIFPRVLGSNYTRDQLDAYHDLTIAPFVMFVAGTAMGWICCTAYVADQTKKPKSPG